LLSLLLSCKILTSRLKTYQIVSVMEKVIVIVMITILGKPLISKCNCTHSKGICDHKYYILNVITTSLF